MQKPILDSIFVGFDTFFVLPLCSRSPKRTDPVESAELQRSCSEPTANLQPRAVCRFKGCLVSIEFILDQIVDA